MTETATKIEIIWDHDHGTENEGWYARATREDGQERDLPFDARESCGDRTITRKARAAVREDGFRIAANCAISITR